MNAVQPFLFGDGWIEVKDGNDSCRAIFDRHYSRYRYADGRRPKIFVGPGEKMVLITPCARAIFVWRKFKSADHQVGVNCAVFRNEGAGLSSDLIKAADDLAWNRWPAERHFTYVNPAAIRSNNPGCCFIAAGWRRCGITQRRQLLILERLPLDGMARSLPDRPSDSLGKRADLVDGHFEEPGVQTVHHGR